MRLIGKLEIKSRKKIANFLNSEFVGRIASIDKEGYPQVIPMNFVYFDYSIYMHSHIRGEKLDNILKDSKVGFEVDKHLEFLPSYFSDPKDASLADTLYISVVIKGNAEIIQNNAEKTLALNELMKKYQPEGGYEPINEQMRVLDAVSIIKIVPITIRGKYKIGQDLNPEEKMTLGQKILKRNSKTSKETLEIMGFMLTKEGIEFADQADEW